jgi:outer membrane protein assembly factor BamA
LETQVRVACTLICLVAAAHALADSVSSQPTPGVPEQQWLSGLPFVPIPKITTDPNSGATVGLIPTWLETDSEHHINRIIAPDIQHDEYFGWGGHMRLLDYPSDDLQQSIVLGVSQRVQRKLDLEYDSGRLRARRWSFTASVVYQRDGTPRFWGIGNDSLEATQTNYTAAQALAQARLGLNLTRRWQLQYGLRWQDVDVLPGTLHGIPSIQALFGDVLGTTRELLNRISIVYDTRDSLNIPSRGMRWVAYGGMAAHGAFGSSAYTESGVDGTVFWPLGQSTTLALHAALRYMPFEQHLAFWELSSLGGDRSFVGGEQPLRGFGAGRFVDRNVSSYSFELRRYVFGLNLFNTYIRLQVAPFLDAGKVFERQSTSPVSDLHLVYGLGLRGVATPFIVGYVDVGYGQEGAAVFTGLDYPF